MSSEEILEIFSDPTITAIIGGAVGAVATFIPTLMLERRKTARFKENVKRLVRIELEGYHNFLSQCIKRGTDDTKTMRFHIGNEMRDIIFKEMDSKQIGDVASFSFRPNNYTSLSTETKSQVFDNDKALVAIEQTYEGIKTFRMTLGNQISHYDIYFQKNDVLELIQHIENALEMIIST